MRSSTLKRTSAVALSLVLSVAACGGETAPDGSGGASTGGAASGSGGEATDGSSGGATNSGGASAGGATSTGGSGGSTLDGEWPLWPAPVPLDLGDRELPIGEVPFDAEATACSPPCALTLELDATDLEDALGATLYVNFEAPSATLRNVTDAAAEGEERVMLFTWEEDYNFGAWASGFTWIYTENYVYAGEPGYGLATDELIFAQLTDSKSGKTVLVVWSFAEGLVRIHSVRVPSCDGNGTSACANATDCPFVDTGALSALSVSCGECYAAARSCSATNCPEDCPGQGGNACLNCEVEAGCDAAFRACSGLDYIPMNALTMPD